MTPPPQATPHIQAVKDGHIATLSVVNEDRRNAINAAMWAQIPQLVAQLEADGDIRAIIVRGAGDTAFCAGADISEFAQTRGTVEAAKAYDRVNAKAYDSLRQTHLPTIAMIHGFCFGGGLGLAACCDIRLGAHDSSYCIPAGRLGLAYPTDNLRNLTNITGPAFAKELLFWGRPVDAQRAYDAGFLNRLVPAAELAAQTSNLCAQIADNAPLSVRAAKTVIDAAAWAPHAMDMDKINANAHACYTSKDYEEGRRAFMEKRKPVFTGK